jgi:hypothetical protein
LVKGAALCAAAFLLMAPQAWAGPSVVAGKATTPSQPAPTPVVRVVRQPVTISIVVTAPSQPAKAPVYARLRGPDGQVRSFSLERGRETIQYPQVLVLRSGQSLTIQWVAQK